MLSHQEVKNRFGRHEGTTEGPRDVAPKHRELHERFIEFAQLLEDILPDGRAKSITFTELESASSWAHKSLIELGDTP